MPVRKGCWPLNTAALEGQQSGEAQWVLAKTMPRLARRSMWGVLTCGCPFRNPTQSFKSSTAMNSTLGRAVSCDQSAGGAPKNAAMYIAEANRAKQAGEIGWIIGAM